MVRDWWKKCKKIVRNIGFQIVKRNRRIWERNKTKKPRSGVAVPRL